MTHSNDLNFDRNPDHLRLMGARQFVGLQGLLSLALFLLMILFGSTPVAVSALWSGLSVFFGNVAFLLVMSSGFFGPSVVSVLIGQFVKWIVVLVLLGLAVWAYDELVWAGFMLGLLVSLLFVFVAPVILKRAEKQRDNARVESLLEVLNNKK